MTNKQFNRTVLCVMDGLGYSAREQGNAVVAAGMPNLTKARNQHLTTLIKASGHEVGLDSAKDAGNSEVGHNAMGAGVTIKQGLSLLNDAFATGKIFESAVWQKICTYPKLNIIILCSNGRVHSNIEHLFQVIEQCKKQNLPFSVIAITDGRDVSPRSAAEFLAQVPNLTVIGGRGQFFMDRYEAQTEMLTKAFEVCVEGKAPVVKDWRKYLEEFYQANPNLSDEQVPPAIIDPNNLIKNGEAILLLNYRGDRAVETARMFDRGDYISAEQRALIKDCYFAGILQYDAEMNLPQNYLCEPPVINHTLTAWLCEHGVRQYTVTETVKFGHMTYFFNGNKSAPIDPKLETWLEIPSDKLNNLYDKAPKMKAVEITDKLIENIENGKFDFLKCNLPNPDMVGHCGNFDAAVTACKTVDECVGRLYDVCQKNKVNLIITADHGNAEEMTDENGKVKTSHTNNLVPIAICPFANPNFELANTEAGNYGLTNLAATICDLMGVPVDPHFNPSMIQRLISIGVKMQAKTILNAKNEKIFVEVYEPNLVKSTIVFCHGITGCRKGRTPNDDYFQKFAAHLCDNNYKVILFDFSGHGDSEGRSEDVCLSKSVDELARVFASEVKTEKYDFLTFSYGTTVLCRFLETHQDVKPQHIAMISPGFDPLYSSFLDTNNIFGKDIANAYYSGAMKKNGYAVVGAKNFKLGINFIEELKSFHPDIITKIGAKLLVLSGNNDIIIDTKFNHEFCQKHQIKNIDYNASHALFEEIDLAFNDIEKFLLS